MARLFVLSIASPRPRARAAGADVVQEGGAGARRGLAPPQGRGHPDRARTAPSLSPDHIRNLDARRGRCTFVRRERGVLHEREGALEMHVGVAATPSVPKGDSDVRARPPQQLRCQEACEETGHRLRECVEAGLADNCIRLQQLPDKIRASGVVFRDEVERLPVETPARRRTRSAPAARSPASRSAAARARRERGDVVPGRAGRARARSA